jgi:hypothetical protein
MIDTFPWDTAPRDLLRDRDKSRRASHRFDRRECLDHVIILNERHLRRVVSSYFQNHYDARTHLSLNKDCPRPRRVQVPSAGNIIASPRSAAFIIAMSVEPREIGEAARSACPHPIARKSFLSNDTDLQGNFQYSRRQIELGAARRLPRPSRKVRRRLRVGGQDIGKCQQP